MVFKSMNGLAPDYLSSKFIQRNDVITSYNLRDSENKFAVPLHSPEYFLFWNCFDPRSKHAIIQSGCTFGVTWYANCFGLSGTPAISESR